MHECTVRSLQRRREADQNRCHLTALVDGAEKIMGWPDSVCRQLLRDGATPDQAYAIVVTALEHAARAP